MRHESLTTDTDICVHNLQECAALAGSVCASVNPGRVSRQIGRQAARHEDMNEHLWERRSNHCNPRNCYLQASREVTNEPPN